MYDYDHVTCLVGEDGVLVCGCIVKELFAVSMVSSVGLAWADAMADSAGSMVESTARP